MPRLPCSPCALYAWAAIGQSRIGALAPADEPRATPPPSTAAPVATAEEARFVAGRVPPGALVQVDDRRAPPGAPFRP
jgi:hypothetical protein